MTTKITGRCFMFIRGADLNCPLCGSLVHSGEHHECVRRSESAEPARPRPRNRSAKKGGAR